MFFEYEGDSYLVGTTVWVDSNASASTITFGQIESDIEYKKNLRREPKRFPLRNRADYGCQRLRTFNLCGDFRAFVIRDSLSVENPRP